MENFVGYALALVIGISLGLIGGGGSILTVPVLVYVLGVSPVLATGYSLFIVGTTSLVGAANYGLKKLIDVKTALIFSLPSFLSVFLVRKFVVPMLPDEMFSTGSLVITKNIFLMVFFSALMFFAALSMIKNDGKKAETVEDETAERTFNYPLILAEGFIVGAITGLVGAGGGFLIIPALVVFAKLPMKLAVGTSLLIIGIKSIVGFGGDVMNAPGIDWVFLLIFSMIASAGIFIGGYLSKYITPASLKKGFGYFLIVMAVYITVKELFL
jgi:uncharacterized membrane protein YfcA